MKRKMIALIASLSILTGCASEAHRQALANLKLACAAGNQDACKAVPAQEEINKKEANKNAGTTIGVLLLVPLLALGAAAGAGVGPHPIPAAPPPPPPLHP
jgi:hypothetical protein